MIFKQKSHEARVLDQLKKAGNYGVFNYELAKPSVGGFRFGEYIRSLRADGHVITTQQISQSVYKYYLNEERIFDNE